MDGGKTGWPAGLLQDDCRSLAKWFASRMDARYVVRQQQKDKDCMHTEDLIALADTYARCNANYHVENLYGTSGSYTEDCARQQQQARQALLDALEALGREQK